MAENELTLELKKTAREAGQKTLLLGGILQGLEIDFSVGHLEKDGFPVARFIDFLRKVQELREVGMLILDDMGTLEQQREVFKNISAQGVAEMIMEEEVQLNLMSTTPGSIGTWAGNNEDAEAQRRRHGIEFADDENGGMTNP